MTSFPASTLCRSAAGVALLWASLAVCLTGCTQDVTDIRVEGIELYRGRQHVESMATLRHALDLEPNDAQSNYYMGLNYRAMAERKFRDGDVGAARRQLDNATVYFTQAIKSWPNYMAAVSAKTEALEARGKYDQALAVAEQVAHNNRGDAAKHFLFLGNEYRERGDYDNALRAYKIALATEPNWARLYAEMGQLYALVGDHALATDTLRRAYELDPDEPGVREGFDRLSRAPEVRTATHALPE